MNDTFTKHNDPGHGWLEVTPSDLKAVGLALSDISGYSFKNRRGTRLFLEEDCDLSVFFNAYKVKHGAYPTYVNDHTYYDFPESMNLVSIHA